MSTIMLELGKLSKMLEAFGWSWLRVEALRMGSTLVTGFCLCLDLVPFHEKDFGASCWVCQKPPYFFLEWIWDNHTFLHFPRGKLPMTSESWFFDLEAPWFARCHYDCIIKYESCYHALYIMSKDLLCRKFFCQLQMIYVQLLFPVAPHHYCMEV